MGEERKKKRKRRGKGKKVEENAILNQM